MTKNKLTEQEKVSLRRSKRSLEARLGNPDLIRIIDKYFKKSGNDLVLYSPAVLAKDFGKDYNDICMKYDGYTCVPSYLNYERDIFTEDGVFWNTHEPLTHDIKPGPFPTIEKLIRHLFRDQYEMALDWLQIVLTNPAHPLPIPCLVSDEQGTGKTSFLKLLKFLFQSNTVEVSIGDLSQRFNGHWASKNLILIDETETDDITFLLIFAAKIKRYVTSTTIHVDEKGIPVYSIPFNGKFVVCSNKERSSLKISQSDTRYWIIKVDTLGKKYDENFFVKLKAECPAFLFFLKSREMQTAESRGRFWFSPDQYRTKAFTEAAEFNKSWLYHEILECIKTYFEDYPSIDEERFTITSIKDMLKESGVHNWNTKWIHTTMQEDFAKKEVNNKWRGKQLRGYNFTRKEILEGKKGKETNSETENLSHNLFNFN